MDETPRPSTSNIKPTILIEPVTSSSESEDEDSGSDWEPWSDEEQNQPNLNEPIAR